MDAYRISEFANESRQAMSSWLGEMSLHGLLFHPEDAQGDLIATASNAPMFTQPESAKLNAILDEMSSLFGEAVCEVVYPNFMKAAGCRLVA